MSVSVIKPIEVTEAVYSASGIAEPDTGRGEVEWEDYESKRVIVEPVPLPSLDKFQFGVFSSESIHDSAVYFMLKFESGNPKFIGVSSNMTESFKVDLSEDPSLIGDQYIVGVHVDTESGLVSIFWQVDNEGAKTYHLNTMIIPSSGSPTYSASGTELTWVPERIKTGNLYISFSKLSDSFLLWDAVVVNEYQADFKMTVFSQSGIQSASIASSQYVSGFCGDSSGVYTLDRTSEGYLTIKRYNRELELTGENKIPATETASGFLGLGRDELNAGLYAGSFFPGGPPLERTQNPAFEVISKVTLDGVNLYNKGDEVITTSNHRKYRSLIDANKSDPRDTATGDATAEWIDIGPTNKWAMFDDSISTKSVVSSQFSFDLSAGTKFDSIAFFGCDGIQYISVTIKNIGGTFVEAKSVDMIDSDAALEWGLDDNSPAFISDALINDLTYGEGYYATVTITPYAGFDAKVQLVSFGLERFLGKVISESTRQNYQDLSEYKFDEFGESVIVKRPVIKMDTYSILTEGARISVVDRFIKSIAGQFNVWYANIGNDQYMLTYGSYERSPTNVTANNHRNYVVTVRSAV